MTPFEWLALLAWAVLVGLDLVSVPQAMIARPLVAGTVAGCLAGDPAAGALVGAVLELFALDVLPIGAVRYPDYGLGGVAAAATAAGAPGVLALGLAVTVGLIVAYVGEGSIRVTRRRTSLDVEAHRDWLNAGDPRAVRRVHLMGIARDAVRSLLVGGFGLLLAFLVRRWAVVSLEGAVLLGIVVVGVGLAAAAAGALRLAGRMRGVGWFALGLAAGAAWVVVT
jgi:PTS system mannose-specific IIC component